MKTKKLIDELKSINISLPTVERHGVSVSSNLEWTLDIIGLVKADKNK